MATLFVVATPIGNLKDLTLRALETLRGADYIAAEDTRVTRKLLAHYDIRKPLVSCHEHSREDAYVKIKEHLRHGKNVALVTDAGTPGVSDPGAKLIQAVRSDLPEIQITPIPGPSALTAALSASGENADRFTFLGYPPRKKGRKTFFSKIREIAVRPIVLYESPHRLEKTLEELEKVYSPNEKIIVGKELTKIYEEMWQGTVSEARAYFVGEKQRGEFVVILP